jgi:SAM-dependent methyltransferase
LAGSFYVGIYGGETVYRERSFFGVHRITRVETENGEGGYELVHGNTVHGRQILDPELRHEPLSYYHRTGPIGDVFKIFSGPSAKKEIALVGLGAGALAAYGEPGQHLTFYEIDPAVVRISRDEGYFTFLSDSRASCVDYVLGDARLTLKKSPDHHYDMIIMDAFSSDSIPLHLLTREALNLYLQKLADGGLLIFHLSNRYLELRPVLGDLAKEAGLVCWGRFQDQESLGEAERNIGKAGSNWLVMARQRSDLGSLIQQAGWNPIIGRPDRPVWTDDFSNLLGVFQWNWGM